MLVRSLAALAVAVVLAAAPSARADEPLTAKQAEAVRKIVRDYIMQNPEIIEEAIGALREKQRLAAEAEAKRMLVERRDEIERDPRSPVGGNAEGDVTLVEFFDYRCPYCKTVHDTVMDVLKQDGKVRFVFKEYPILGPDSVFAARAALAAREQGKYAELHTALMQLKGAVTEQSVLKAAAALGLDMERLKKDMGAAGVAADLHRNMELAEALNISGTPAFVVGERIIPGAMDAASLKDLIQKARKKGE